MCGHDYDNDYDFGVGYGTDCELGDCGVVDKDVN